MENFNETVQIRKWVLALIGGLPSLAILIIAFNMGSWRGELDGRIFDSKNQKRDVLQQTFDPDTHMDIRELDARYMPRTEVKIHLEQIEKNQEKIMNKLNIN